MPSALQPVRKARLDAELKEIRRARRSGGRRHRYWEHLLPAQSALSFGVQEAAAAARVYRQIGRSRGREIDVVIAACAIVRSIPLWTVSRNFFADIPGLALASLD